MKLLYQMLEFNQNFVENKDYLDYQTTKRPDKQMMILSCMDTRLTELLPKALNLKNGDAKIIKNAGALIKDPLDYTIRSIVIGLYVFNIEEIFVIGHEDCGMCKLDVDDTLTKMTEKGIQKDALGIDLKKWLQGFDSIEESIIDTVTTLKNHPLIHQDVVIHGLLINPETGKIKIIVDGYKY